MLNSGSSAKTPSAEVAVLTAGRDKPYALGLAAALLERGISFEFLGSDELDSPDLRRSPLITVLNLRGDQTEKAPFHRKVIRVLRYYRRLVTYAVFARPRVFHVLWNNKFEWLDRTLLMGFYRVCGRKVAFTAHNVNAGERDGSDSVINRFTLGVQYRLSNAVFVHTEQMRRQLQTVFQVPNSKIHVIPFPVNNTIPDTKLDGPTARARLGLRPDERVLLFYGRLAAYKGLEYLVQALALLRKEDKPYRLLIAGDIKKNAEEYWREIQKMISRLNLDALVLPRIEFIPDEETELYFKAADALILPYVYIFQSGVLFLSYNFGLPVLAADVGSLKDDIVEGKTGFVFRPKDPEALASRIQEYFQSDLYQSLPARRVEIQKFAFENYSWGTAAATIEQVYSSLLDRQ